MSILFFVVTFYERSASTVYSVRSPRKYVYLIIIAVTSQSGYPSIERHFVFVVMPHGFPKQTPILNKKKITYLQSDKEDKIM